jgi:hypothetical protein
MTRTALLVPLLLLAACGGESPPDGTTRAPETPRLPTAAEAEKARADAEKARAVADRPLTDADMEKYIAVVKAMPPEMRKPIPPTEEVLRKRAEAVKAVGWTETEYAMVLGRLMAARFLATGQERGQKVPEEKKADVAIYVKHRDAIAAAETGP